MCHLPHSLGQSRRLDLSELQPPRIESTELTHARPVVRCAGEIDGAVAPRLSALLDAACDCEVEGVLLDLAEVTLIDARVLAVVEATRLRLERCGADLRVAAAGQPLRLLRLTGLDRKLTTIACPRVEPWLGPSSSSSSPTSTSAPAGMAATR